MALGAAHLAERLSAGGRAELFLLQAVQPLAGVFTARPTPALLAAAKHEEERELQAATKALSNQVHELHGRRARPALVPAQGTAPPRRSTGITVLAIEKAFGAGFFLAAAITLLALHARQVTHPLQVAFANELREDPHDALANLLIGLLPQVSATALLTLGLVALGDMLLHAVEAVGLWLGQLWVEYLILVETTALLPYEAYEIVRHLTPFKVLALGINLVVVPTWLGGGSDTARHDASNP